jgi:hypothetical protein
MQYTAAPPAVKVGRTENLHGLPVVVVDRDAGADAASGRVDWASRWWRPHEDARRHRPAGGEGSAAFGG